MEPFAHTRNAAGDYHLLSGHLLEVAQQAKHFAEPLGAPSLAYTAGLLHDLGKFHPLFQHYLLAAEQNPLLKGQGPDHKGAGAVHAMAIRLELLAFLIAGHHGGLPARTDLKVWLRERVRDPAVQEAIRVATEVFPELSHLRSAPHIFPDSVQTPSEVELFIRMLFSALVDADFLNTEAHFRPEVAAKRSGSPPITALWKTFEAYHQGQLSRVLPSQINALRQQVYQQCYDAAVWLPGFFRLTVPTGGGKTRSSLAFALRHAVSHHLRRVIYAIPYMSITEQTADVFRDIFPDSQIILEHHSGILSPDNPLNTTPQQLWSRLAAENWESPIIVTTTVQLFESLLAHTPSGCRKLHHIADSVIILDEAQMLPTHLLETILDVLQQLVRYYGVSVVLCTATQPALDQRAGFPGLQGIREIISDPEALFTALNRVRYQWPQYNESWSWRQVAAQANQVQQALIIVNTRKDAVHALHALNTPDALHLSTSMCGAHRRVILKEIRRRLDPLVKEPCHVVSTQLIEAGVDVDFPLVLRAMGPFDSIAQAAGRCNREGLLPQKGTIIIFRPEEGGLPPGSYRTGTMLTQALLQQGVIDPADPATYRRYFERYYALVDRDEPQVQQVRLQMDYPAVSSRFRMIEEAFPVVVTYEPPEKPTHVADLLDAIRQQPTQRRILLRQLQQYMVTLRAKEMLWAQSHHLIEEIIPGLFLWKEPYDPLCGLIIHKQ